MVDRDACFLLSVYNTPPPPSNNSLHLSCWSAGFMHTHKYMQYNFFLPPFFYFIIPLSVVGSLPCIYLWCNTIVYSHQNFASIFCESACPQRDSKVASRYKYLYLFWLIGERKVVVVAALAVDQRWWWWWWGWSTVTTMVVVLVVDQWWPWWLVIAN